MGPTLRRGLVRRGLAVSAVLGLWACMPPRRSYFLDEASHLAHRARLEATEGAGCPLEPRPADAATSVPRPDRRAPDRRFDGDFHGQTESVWLDGETYSYLERWHLGVIGDWFLIPVGSDWKVRCRIDTCRLTTGDVCCYQECADGGASGGGYEPPDRFGCMNTAAGGQFQWFLDGLHESGVRGLAACSQPPLRAPASRAE